ncbi:hypothetical protein [Streptomyces pseudovenezuelae]|uniref:DUF7187 family protein n=1 Tax=Streptomyces pseudovenezuelae TaxID=67350 RepID=UPI002E335C31|nr:hypothetical protein [Streptomyces pseudovenezuelae]
MSEEEFPEQREGVEVVDHFSNVKRAASIVGDLRAALRGEGFTREETFELVRTYWAAELGMPE